MKTYYDILEISKDALASDIRDAYKRLALLNHPDKNASTDTNTQIKVTEKFKGIVEAYKKLSNPHEREKYDRHLRSQTVQKIEPISGFITHPVPSLGQKYKGIHAKFLQDETVTPQENKPHFKLDSDKHASQNEEGFSEPMASNIPFVSPSFAPTSAFKLYIDYLNNHTTGAHLKCWFEQAILEEQQTKNDPLTLGLYEGFLELITNKSPIYAAIKKIIHYVRYQNPDNLTKAVEELAFLFQHKVFRALFREGLEIEWEQPINIDIPSLFSSELDQRLENDLNKEKPLYLHVLYDVQKQLKKKYLEVQNAPCQADAWRALAFECLDYVHIVNTNNLMAINLILQACLFLKQAIQTEENIHKQFADEKLIILLAAFCANMSQRDKPSVDFYAHQHSIHFITNLKFKHPELSMVSSCLKNRMYLLMDFFPCMTEMHSNLNLLSQETSQLAYLRQYMMTLKEWLDHNKACSPEEEKLLTLKEVDILYHLYEAHINLWAKKPSDDNDALFDPEEEQSLRTQLMEATLTEGSASFVDISKNVHPDWNMVNRNEFGWMNPAKPLPFIPGLKIYQSIEGLEFNDKGEVQFVFKEWNEEEPLSKQAFSSLDFWQMLENNILAASFSLDQRNSQYPYDPFQTMTYSPANLQDTEYLFTLFDTDYLLKFFTTGQEVQGQFPYAMRPVQTILDALPEHLQKIVNEFKSSKQTGQVNRFWIEADTIPVLEETRGTSTRRFTFGEIRMSLKTHPMVYDDEGNLKDTKDVEEGWNIYLLDDIRAFEPETIGKDFQFRAIIIIRNNDLVYFFEEQKLSRFPSRIKLSTTLQEELLVQNFNPQGLMIKGQIPYQDNGHFVYQLTTYICETIKKPTHFSSERVFAEKFTEHYDGFAQAFPSFYRLKELSRATAVIAKLNIVYQTHAKILLEHQQKLSLYQEVFTEKEDECVGFYNRIENEYATEIDNLTKELQQKRQMIGILTHTSSSPELVAFCQKNSSDPNDPVLIAQFNAAGRRKRVQYQQEIASCYQDVSNFLTAKDFNNRVESFFNGDVKPLAEGIAKLRRHNTIAILQQKLEAKFSGFASPAEIEEALTGNSEPLAKALATHSMGKSGNISDRHLSEIINTQKLFLERFRELGIGNEAKSVNDKRLNWIPAACDHTVGKETVSFVYGGVCIIPSMVCKLEAARHSYRLQMPSESAFAGNLDRIKAREFIQELKSGLNSIPYSYKANTFEVESMIRDLEWKLAYSPRLEPAPSFIYSTPQNFAFRQTPSPNLCLSNILTEGIVGKAEYQRFNSETPQSREVKSDPNKESHNNFEGLFSPLALVRAAKRLEGLKKVVTEYCKDAKSEGLCQLPFAHKNLAHKSPAQLQTHFLNVYEKLRTEQANEIKKAQEAKIQAEREEMARPPIKDPKFIPDAYNWEGTIDYAQAIFTGVKKGTISFVNDILHPIDNILYPMSELVVDASVIATASIINTLPDHPALEDFHTLQSIIKDSGLYQEAALRMHDRVNALKESWTAFEQASDLERVEKLSELGTTIFAPGFIVRSARCLTNYKHFGQLSAPTFEKISGKSGSSDWLIRSIKVKDIRDGLTPDVLMYVIDKDRKLIITPQNYDGWHLDHSVLGQGKGVYAAGDVFLEKGKIVRIDSRSGSYAPQGEHLGPLVEHAFVKDGFSEATGKFVDWRKEILLNLPGERLAIPKISQDKIGFRLASGAFFKEFYKQDGVFSEHKKSIDPLWTGSVAMDSVGEEKIAASPPPVLKECLKGAVHHPRGNWKPKLKRNHAHNEQIEKMEQDRAAKIGATTASKL